MTTGKKALREPEPATEAETLRASMLPEHAYVNTVPLEHALRDLRHAAETTSQKDKVLLLERADRSITMAVQGMRSTIGIWSSYNRQAEALIATLTPTQEG